MSSSPPDHILTHIASVHEQDVRGKLSAGYVYMQKIARKQGGFDGITVTCVDKALSIGNIMFSKKRNDHVWEFVALNVVFTTGIMTACCRALQDTPRQQLLDQAAIYLDQIMNIVVQTTVDDDNAVTDRIMAIREEIVRLAQTITPTNPQDVHPEYVRAFISAQHAAVAYFKQQRVTSAPPPAPPST